MFNRSLLKAALLVCALCPVVSYGLTSAQTVNAQLSATSPNQILAQAQSGSSLPESQERTATGLGSTSMKVLLIRQDS